MEAQKSTATRSTKIEWWFSQIILELDGTTTTTLSVDAVKDARDKFRLWAGNIGARNAPETSFSLESRLAAAGELLERVTDLLTDIAEALDDLFQIVAGNHDNRIIDAIPSSPGESPPQERDEAHDLLDIANECISSLLRISILIRKSSPRDRFSKALEATSTGKRFYLDQFDISHVYERYPKLKRDESRQLCERLGRAITKRRQFLRYMQYHRLRVSGGPEWNEGVDAVDEEEVTKAILAKNAFVMTGNTTVMSGGSVAISASEGVQTRGSTKASTLDVAKLALLQADVPDIEDTKSYVSASSSFQMAGSGDSTLRLPTLAQVSKGEAVFECPFCFGLQTMTRDWEWRQHALHDLKAYVCTQGGAECESLFFGNSRTWFEHEVLCHRRKWTCVLCHKGPFDSSQQMEDHTRSKHADIVPQESQWKVVVEASQQSADAIPARDCPFCDEWAESLRITTGVPERVQESDMVVTVDPTQFRRHVAAHQEQLALFAIPRMTEDEDDDHELPDSLSRSVSSLRERLGMVRDGDGNDIETIWPADPPLHIAAASGNLEEVARLLQEGADPLRKGETWRNVFDAAAAYRSSLTRTDYFSEVTSLVRQHMRNRHDPAGFEGIAESRWRSAPGADHNTARMYIPRRTSSIYDRSDSAYRVSETKGSGSTLGADSSWKRSHRESNRDGDDLVSADGTQEFPVITIQEGSRRIRSRRTSFSSGTHAQEQPLPQARSTSSNIAIMAARIKTLESFGRALYLCTLTPSLDFLDLSNTIRSLCAVLKHLGTEVEDPSSSLNWKPDAFYEKSAYISQLEPIVEDCDFTLMHLQKILENYGGGKSGKEAESKEKDMITLIRTKLAHQKTTIDIFLDTVQLHNPAWSRTVSMERYQEPVPLDISAAAMTQEDMLSRYGSPISQRPLTNRSAKRAPVPEPAPGHTEPRPPQTVQAETLHVRDRDHDIDASSTSAAASLLSYRTRRRSYGWSEDGYDDRQASDDEELLGIAKGNRSPSNTLVVHHERERKPTRGILKPPRPQFPEEPNPIKEGVAPHKDGKKKADIPVGARWTKINRALIDPEALEIGKERFELRDDFVIVLRVLSKEEIQAYAASTRQLRETKRMELSKKVVDEWELARNKLDATSRPQDQET